MNQINTQITKRCFFISIVISFVCLGFLITCSSADEMNNSTGDRIIEIYHFHPTNGCHTCTTIGEYAEETVKKNYPAELENKTMIFDHINFQDPKNAELVKKFGVTGSSLMIGVTDPSGFHKEEDIKVWYKTGNKDEFMSYLKGLLDRRLAGSFE